MAESHSDRILATDIVSAAKAQVEKLKEAKAQVEAKRKELEADRRTLDSDRREFAKMQQALEELKADIDRRDDELKAREADLSKENKALREAQDKLGAEENRLKEWARALQVTEQEVKDLQTKARMEREEIAAKLSEATAKVAALSERQELIAKRESALAESVDRLSKIQESIAAREKALTTHEEEFIRLQNERMAALQRRDSELTAVMETLTKRMRDQEGQMAALIAMEQSLRLELEKISKERDRLVDKERSIAEVERGLASVLEASGIEWAATPSAAKESPRPAKPAAEKPFAPEPPKTSALPPPPKHIAARESEPQTAPAPVAKATKTQAVDRMNKALESAKKARDAGQDVTEIRKILKDARAAFEEQNFDEAIRLSGKILDVLSSRPIVAR